MSYLQRATGEFSIHVTGPFHCGPNHESPKTFSYDVELAYPASALDSQGFLLDNTAFHDYFSSIGATELSCELLARQAAYDLLARCSHRAHYCKVCLTAFRRGALEARIEHTARTSKLARFARALQGTARV
jgi:hypothetical protein